MEFKDYGFKPVDVINGLNKYYSEKDSKYLHITKAKHNYWHLLDTEVTDAINWLRDEHNIFYTPGMKLEDPVNLDIFDTPRYKFLSILSSELGFRTIVGPGNADKTEDDILRVVKSRNERANAADDSRREFLRKLGCELGVLYPVVKPGSEEKTEEDILERISKLKEGNWPCENGTTFAAYMRKQFLKECEKWNVTPLQGGSVHDWVQYIFEVLDEWRKRAIKAEGFRKEKQAVENVLAELRAKVREIYRSIVDDEWDERLSYTSALNDINEEYKRVVRDFAKATDNWSNMSLQEFRDNVCEIFDIPSSIEDEQILKEVDDVADRYDELEDFRADICGILDIEGMVGTPQQNDKYILERLEKLNGDVTSLDRYARLRSNVCTELCLGGETSDEDILHKIENLRDEENALQWFKKRVAKELCMSEDSTKAEIITAVNAIMDHATDLTLNAVDKDNYEAFRKAIWEAMDRKPETLPEEDSRIVSEVAMMKEGEKHLLQFRDEIAKAIGITYPTTNNFITTRVADIYKDCGELNDLIPKLRGDVSDLQVKCNDMRSKFEFQSGLRQQWHVRYESEHERANGVQKCLDKTREALRVKDISLETAKKQYEKVCGNLETAECALNGMKSKVRELREEKTKVITALGQDIWDDAVK